MSLPFLFTEDLLEYYMTAMCDVTAILVLKMDVIIRVFFLHAPHDQQIKKRRAL